MAVGTALAVSGGISAITSLMAGNAQANAAEKGANAMLAASERSVKEQARQYDLTRSDFEPWRETGKAALQRLSEIFLGVPAEGSQPTTRSVSETVPGRPVDADRVAKLQNQIAATPAFVYRDIGDGNPAPYDNPELMYLRRELNSLTSAAQPQIVTRQVPVPGSGETVYPDYSEFFKTPGYQFRMDEGVKALDRSAAARGGLRGGGHERELVRYGQGVASDEFNNYANRLASMAGQGQTATGQTAAAGTAAANATTNALMTGASGYANAMFQAGTARASGYVGAGNAVSGAVDNWMLYNAMRG